MLQLLINDNQLIQELHIVLNYGILIKSRKNKLQILYVASLFFNLTILTAKL